MTALITGGAGYLGTVLTRRLLALGHHVRLFDRFLWGVQPVASLMARRGSLSVCAGDVRDARDLRPALHGVDVIVHLAAIVGYPACDADPQAADTTNVDGTRLVASLAQGRPLLFASTGSCYGHVDGLASEDTPLSPLTRYGRTKALGEQAILDVGGICLRLATLFGLSPRMRWDLLPNDFAQRGARDGVIRVYDAAARRTFLHVEDAACAFIAVWERVEHGRNRVYNVGDAALNLTKGDVARHVQILTSCTIADSDGHDPDGRDYAVDYRRIAKLWCVRYGFDLGDVVQMARVWR